MIRGLDLGEQRLLWQALTLCVLGPMTHDDDDLLHVMFGKREDGQYRAQVDRKNEKGVEHLLGWHGEIEGADDDMTWRVR